MHFCFRCFYSLIFGREDFFPAKPQLYPLQSLDSVRFFCFHREVKLSEKRRITKSWRARAVSKRNATQLPGFCAILSVVLWEAQIILTIFLLREETRLTTNPLSLWQKRTRQFRKYNCHRVHLGHTTWSLSVHTPGERKWNCREMWWRSLYQGKQFFCCFYQSDLSSDKHLSLDCQQCFDLGGHFMYTTRNRLTMHAIARKEINSKAMRVFYYSYEAKKSNE